MYQYTKSCSFEMHGKFYILAKPLCKQGYPTIDQVSIENTAVSEKWDMTQEQGGPGPVEVTWVYGCIAAISYIKSYKA